MLKIIRAKFSKGEPVKFISHLDLIRVFERALRRTDLPVAYSQGFNPRPRMSFGPPLSVGITSDAEWADFEMEQRITSEECRTSLNAVLPSGVEILEAGIVSPESKSLAALLTAARYEVEVAGGEGLEEKIVAFLAQNEILVSRKTEDLTKVVDVRPSVIDLRPLDFARGKPATAKLELLLSLGGKGSARPTEVVSALSPGLKMLRVHRTALYEQRNGQLVEPGALL